MLKGTKGKVEKFNDFTYETQPKDVIERFALELASTPRRQTFQAQDIPAAKTGLSFDARILPISGRDSKSKSTFEATFEMQKKLVASTALRSWILSNSRIS
jgi:hypothetical protein